MYGLYRAWFGGGGGGGGGAANSNNYPCLQDTFSPPDTVVRVGNEGEHQFVAHKGVLAAHSGYLKALLASATATTATTTTTTTSPDGGDTSATPTSCSLFDPTCATVAAVATIGQSQRSQPVTSVSVSSVGGEAFAPLLNYMYTGRLEVTLDNVYSVLLATHLLHMPGALEQCRAALLRLRAPPPLPTPLPTSTSPPATAGSILRPIPSRLLAGPPLCWPPTTPLYQPSAPPAPASVTMSHLPMTPSVLMRPTVTTGIGVHAPGAREKQEQRAHYSAGEISKSSPRSSPTSHPRHRKRPGPPPCHRRSRTPEIVSTVALPFVAAAAAAFTAFAVTSGATTNDDNTTTRAAPSPSRTISPATSVVSRTHSPPTITLMRRNHRSTTMTTTTRMIMDHRRGMEGDVINVTCNDQHQRRSQCAATTASVDGGPGRNRGSSSSGNNNNNNNSGDNNTGDAITEHDRARFSTRRRTARTGTSGNPARETASTSTVLSVIYDIACCDGPVRFHRVLNENYPTTAITTPTYGSGLQTRADPQRSGCQQRPEEGEDPTSENDENGGPATAAAAAGGGGGPAGRNSSDSSNDGSNGATNCYTCGYCKHTFKSQYCYRKHAKRHLLPTATGINDETTTTTMMTTMTTTTSGGSGPRSEAAARAGNRREVRLLDLNVQYYPCKICGCKFPSYYFVHKHRKLCHNGNDEERQVAANTPGDTPGGGGGGDANASPSIRDAP